MHSDWMAKGPERAKKACDAASRRMRADAVAAAGSWTTAAPVLASVPSPMGKLAPSSRLRLATTSVHGGVKASVPPTLQASSMSPGRSSEPREGDVTAKGEAKAGISSDTSDDTAAPPTPGRLSRTKTRKVRVTPPTVGNISPGEGTPARTSASRGNVRAGEIAGGKILKSAPCPLSNAPSPLRGRANPESYCSHEYVSGSPSRSVAAATSLNAVAGGIMPEGVTDVSSGTLLPLGVMTAQLLPLPAR